MAARVLLSITALVFLSGCAQTQPPAPPQATLTIAGQTLSITKAVTREELGKGLGGVTSLAADHGMLFLFGGYAERTFWMKGMLIPIDIIWLDGEIAAGFETNVQPPVSSAADSSLPLYTSPRPVNYVLEVQAGFVEKYGVTIGDRVELTGS